MLNYSYLDKYLYFFFDGVKVTIIFSIISIILGFVLGSVVGFIRTINIDHRDSKVSKFLKKTIYYIATAYVEYLRGTPFLVQIMFIYFGGGMLFPGLDRMLAAIVAMTLNTGAYVAEIIRAGIMSVDKGQYEAARSLGMNHMQASFKIIYPQAIKNIIPALVNEFIVIIKDSSLIMVIGVPELMYRSKQVVANTYEALSVYFLAANMYFILTFTLSRLLSVVENRMRKGDVR